MVYTDDDKSSWVGFSLSKPYTQGALCLSAEAELNKSNQHDMGAAETPAHSCKAAAQKQLTKCMLNWRENSQTKQGQMHPIGGINMPSYLTPGIQMSQVPLRKI